MTTKLTKPVSREVATRRSGDLIITLTDAGVVVREKGRRTKYPPIAYGKLLIDGARLYIAAEKARKAEQKALRRIARGGR